MSEVSTRCRSMTVNRPSPYRGSSAPGVGLCAGNSLHRSAGIASEFGAGGTAGAGCKLSLRIVQNRRVSRLGRPGCKAHRRPALPPRHQPERVTNSGSTTARKVPDTSQNVRSLLPFRCDLGGLLRTGLIHDCGYPGEFRDEGLELRTTERFNKPFRECRLIGFDAFDGNAALGGRYQQG